MPIDTSNQGGRYTVRYQAPRRGLRTALSLACVAGVGGASAFAWSTAHPPPTSAVVLGVVLAAFVFWMLAEVSRKACVTTSLHLASGEIEIRAGRGPLSIVRTFGVFEARCVRLGWKSCAGETRAYISVIPCQGAPLCIIPEDPSDSACSDIALTLSQGARIPLLDDRFVRGRILPSTGGAQAAPASPGPVAATGEPGREVYTWDARYNLRPYLILSGVAVWVVLGSILAGRSVSLGSWVLPISAALVFLALGLAAHTVACVAVRRITVRQDAVRFERMLGGVSLLSRVTPFEEIKAVLISRHGPYAFLHVRLAHRRPPLVLPFERPALMGWLKSTLDVAAHSSGERSLAERE